LGFFLFFFFKKRTHARANSTRCDCPGTRRETKRMKTLRCTSPHVPAHSATLVPTRLRSANPGTAFSWSPTYQRGVTALFPPLQRRRALLTRMHLCPRPYRSSTDDVIATAVNAVRRICERNDERTSVSRFHKISSVI